MKLKLGIIASSGLSAAVTFISNFLLSTVNGKIFGINENLEVQEITTLGSNINDLEYDSVTSTTLAAGNGGLLLSSTDNTTWTTITTPTSKDINKIKYVNGTYFIGVDNV